MCIWISWILCIIWMKHLDPPHCVAFTDRKYFGLAAKRKQRESGGGVQRAPEPAGLSLMTDPKQRGAGSHARYWGSFLTPAQAECCFSASLSREFSLGLTGEAEMFLSMELEATGKTCKRNELTFLWTPTKTTPVFAAADGRPFPLSSQQWVSSRRKTLAAVFLIVLTYLSLSLLHSLHGKGLLPFLLFEWCFPSGIFSEKSNYVFSVA